jgi:hypothetical protein
MTVLSATGAAFFQLQHQRIWRNTVTASPASAIGQVVIGVDTHKELHVAAAVDVVGGLRSTLTITNDETGFDQLTAWAVEHGQVLAWAVEGTGSYGKRLTRHLLGLGATVIEVCRP